MKIIEWNIQKQPLSILEDELRDAKKEISEMIQNLRTFLLLQRKVLNREVNNPQSMGLDAAGIIHEFALLSHKMGKLAQMIIFYRDFSRDLKKIQSLEEEK